MDGRLWLCYWLGSVSLFRPDWQTSTATTAAEGRNSFNEGHHPPHLTITTISRPGGNPAADRSRNGRSIGTRNRLGALGSLWARTRWRKRREWTSGKTAEDAERVEEKPEHHSSQIPFSLSALSPRFLFPCRSRRRCRRRCRRNRRRLLIQSFDDLFTSRLENGLELEQRGKKRLASEWMHRFFNRRDDGK